MNLTVRASLFDIQVNGFAGVDFQSPRLGREEARRAVDALARHETLRFFPTFITDEPDRLEAKLANFEKIRAGDPVVAAAACGYHIEGPWLSPQAGFHGAHRPELMRAPDLAVFDRLQKAAGGRIKLVTLAPEWEGSAGFIRVMTERGVEVSLGHTDADDAAIDAAIEAGARFCTHLGNGVPENLHRHENITQRLLSRDALIAFFIPDGIHLPPAVLRNFFRAKPRGRALFTTDCMAAAGAPPGLYSLAGLELEVGPDRVVRVPGSTNFAGSSLAPDEGLENVCRWLGMEMDEARPLFSTAVARAFRIDLPFAREATGGEAGV